MKHTHILHSHNDIGYNKFFDQFREEYNSVYLDMSEWDRINFINDMFIKYKCNAQLWVSGRVSGITFDSEQYFHMFVLRWS